MNISEQAFSVRSNAYRWSCLVEALAYAGFLAWYIWKFQVEPAWTWRLLMVWLVVTFFLRRDTPKTMGWRVDNLCPATKRASLFFAASSLLTVLAGIPLGVLHRLPTHLSAPNRFWGYLVFCLLQQVGLNSFLMNRLLTAFESPLPAALVAGSLFAALHWPNPLLVPLTFLGGTAMAWLFATERNILPLTLGQAILGELVRWAFPLAWHHSMASARASGHFPCKKISKRFSGLTCNAIFTLDFLPVSSYSLPHSARSSWHLTERLA